MTAALQYERLGGQRPASQVLARARRAADPSARRATPIVAKGPGKGLLQCPVHALALHPAIVPIRRCGARAGAPISNERWSARVRASVRQ